MHPYNLTLIPEIAILPNRLNALILYPVSDQLADNAAERDLMSAAKWWRYRSPMKATMGMTSSALGAGGMAMPPNPASADTLIVAALRQGDETAFVTLITQYNNALVKLALVYVGSHAVAEEVVQETWLGVLKGINRFEGRSSLKTWIFRILVNIARTRGVREGRSVPFSALEQPDAEGDEPAVEPERFRPPDHRSAGWWVAYPSNWEGVPEERLLSQETWAMLQSAINALPPSQRTVINLRDVEGWSVDEVCAVLGVSEGNQRVLLHRARAKVRHTLEHYLDES